VAGLGGTHAQRAWPVTVCMERGRPRARCAAGRVCATALDSACTVRGRGTCGATALDSACTVRGRGTCGATALDSACAVGAGGGAGFRHPREVQAMNFRFQFFDNRSRKASIRYFTKTFIGNFWIRCDTSRTLRACAPRRACAPVYFPCCTFSWLRVRGMRAHERRSAGARRRTGCIPPERASRPARKDLSHQRYRDRMFSSAFEPGESFSNGRLFSGSSGVALTS